MQYEDVATRIRKTAGVFGALSALTVAASAFAAYSIFREESSYAVIAGSGSLALGITSAIAGRGLGNLGYSMPGGNVVRSLCKSMAVESSYAGGSCAAGLMSLGMADMAAYYGNFAAGGVLIAVASVAADTCIKSAMRSEKSYNALAMMLRKTARE